MTGRFQVVPAGFHSGTSCAWFHSTPERGGTAQHTQITYTWFQFGTSHEAR